MFVSVLNFAKYRKRISLIKSIAIVIIITVIAGAFLTSLNPYDDYIKTMQAENEKSLVIIDAGHGGEDSGAIGFSGVYEKDLNFDIAFELGAALEKAGFAVLFTRSEDKLLYTEKENIKGIRKISDLKNRCKIAAEYPDAMFVSIHMNSYASPEYYGLQVYYSTKNDASLMLAGSIQNNVRTILQPENKRSVKAGDKIYVLENVDNSAVLIECGFITNEEECKKLLQKEYQKQLSSAIVCGIIEYRNKISAS